MIRALLLLFAVTACEDARPVPGVAERYVRWCREWCAPYVATAIVGSQCVCAISAPADGGAK